MHRIGTPADAGRVGWVDAAKGICIVFVVMMHATLGVGEAMGGEGFMHWVVAFAAPFRMPDFFLISGLFLARVVDRDWRTYGDKRILHFVYFYLLWLVIQSLVKIGTVSDGTLAGFLEHLAISLVEPFSTLWFVYMLAIFSIVAKLVRRVNPVLVLAAAAALEIAPIHTGWFLLDEFAARLVYFLAGWHLAPMIFRLAEAAVARRAAALGFLGVWAVVNGVLALTTVGVLGTTTTLAALPVVSLALGVAGAVAIVCVSALIAGTMAGRPFAYAGQHSIAIYLAFFFPMAATREVLLRTGLVEDVGVVSLVVTLGAVIAPLVLERIVRNTPAAFLFERPAWARLPPRRAAMAPAE
ncbi:acyltransferase family protein [Salinarimonas rosea]|uniref:acyltransferase family protein n=1 Tax=Salinarimonas rosea TaxID=552063 RepID=UPI00041182C0|nr:acyltransferase family protein [Salinarimonas rosea]